MSRYDSMVSAEAWDRLFGEYRDLDQTDDFKVAELLRRYMQEVEGV